MLAHWDLHNWVILFEVLQAQAALFLLRHISKGMASICLLLRHLLILHSLHDSEIDSNDGLCLLVKHLIVVKLTVVVQSVRFAPLAAAAFPLSEEETDYFDEQNNQEKDDGPRDEDQDDSMPEVVITNDKLAVVIANSRGLRGRVFPRLLCCRL